MELKQKQEDESRTRALKNEQRRYGAKNAEYTGIEFPPGKGLKISGTHALEVYCHEDPWPHLWFSFAFKWATNIHYYNCSLYAI